MKTLNDVKQDMSELFESVKADQMELKKAAELSNIAGKFLKAEQLQLARDIFLKESGRVLPALPGNEGARPQIGGPPPDTSEAAASH